MNLEAAIYQLRLAKGHPDKEMFIGEATRILIAYGENRFQEALKIMAKRGS